MKSPVLLEYMLFFSSSVSVSSPSSSSEHIRSVLKEGKKYGRLSAAFSQTLAVFNESRRANVFLSLETFLLSKCRKASRPRASKSSEITLACERRACQKALFSAPLPLPHSLPPLSLSQSFLSFFPLSLSLSLSLSLLFQPPPLPRQEN